MDLDQLLHTTGQTPDPLALPAWTPPAPRRRVVTPARVGVAAAVVAAAIVVPTIPTGGTGSTPPAAASAAEVLHRAAVAAGAQPDGNWRSAPYWYSKSTYERGGKTETREIWIGHKAGGVLKDGGLDARVEPLGEAALFDDGGDWDSLWSLPTDPAKLAAHFRKAGKGEGNNPDSELFVWVGDYLRESPAPPKLRAALYEVAARIPGVKLLGERTDSLGRTGTAVERDGQTLLFSTTDGALLAETEGDPAAPDEVYKDDQGNVVGSGSRGFAATYVEQHAAQTAPTPSSDFKVNGDGSVTILDGKVQP